MYVLVVTTPAPHSTEVRHNLRSEHGPRLVIKVAEILRHIDPHLTREERHRIGAQIMRHGQKRTLAHGPTGHTFRVVLADTAGLDNLLTRAPAQRRG